VASSLTAGRAAGAVLRRGALLPLLLAALAPRAAGQAGAKDAPSERALLATFREAFASAEAAERVGALAALGMDSRGLPDRGTGKRVAQALARGLEDEDLDVRQAALAQLDRERDVDTVIGAFTAFLRGHYRALERHQGNVDGPGRDFYTRGSVLFQNACNAFANYRDDRTAAVLVPLLENLPADSRKGDLGPRVVGALAASALDQGTLAAAEAAVRQTKAFSPTEQESGARALHAALAAFASGLDTTPPEWSEEYADEWQAWLEEHAKGLPKKIGRLAEPPASEPKRPRNGLPGKSG